jgi:hypothetical protein
MQEYMEIVDYTEAARDYFANRAFKLDDDNASYAAEALDAALDALQYTRVVDGG